MSRNCRLAVAVHVAAILAMQGETPSTSDWIAGSVNTNPVVVRRILAALSKAGIVSSHRGTTGGSVLIRHPEAISLLDLARAVDDEDGPSLHHQPPNPVCPVGAHILPVLTGILTDAEAQREKALAGVTIAGVLDAIQQRAARLQPNEASPAAILPPTVL